VAGWISTSAWHHQFQCRQSHIQSTRSASRSNGLDRPRWSTASWWRRMAFSATREIWNRAMPRSVRRSKRSHEIIVPWSATEDQEVNNCSVDEVFTDHGSRPSPQSSSSSPCPTSSTP